MRKTIALATLMLAFLILTTIMPLAKATTFSYWWDGVQFVEGQYIKYPHANRDYYGISPYKEWSMKGGNLYHHQFDHDKSLAIVVSLPVIGTAMGAIIGYQIGGPYGGVIGGVTGAVLGAVLTWVAYAVFLDEYDCLWWWVSINFTDWLAANAVWLGWECISNPTKAMNDITTAFLTSGYLRAGLVTFYNGIGIRNDPGPGDLDNNGKVNILDLVIVGLAFGSKPGDANWNPVADVYPDNIINIVDVLTVAIHFGEG